MFDLEQVVEGARAEVRHYIESIFTDWENELRRKPSKPKTKIQVDDNEDQSPGCTWNTGSVDADSLLREARRALHFLSHSEIEKESREFDPLHKVKATDLEEWNRIGPLILRDGCWLDTAVKRNARVEMLAGDIPSFAYVGWVSAETDEEEAAQKPDNNNVRSSVSFLVIERTAHLAPAIFPIEQGMLYEVCRLAFRKSGIFCARDYVTIADDGHVYPCRRLLVEHLPIQTRAARGLGTRGKLTITRNMYRTEADPHHLFKNTYNPCVFAAMALTSWQTRDIHWTATFSNGKRQVHFSINEASAKRLLAQRDKCGDRRLHWVAAHERTSGAKVRTHLRGDTLFHFGDLTLQLQMPGVKCQARTAKQAEKLRPMLNSRYDRIVHQQWGTSDPLIHKLLRRANLSLISKKRYEKILRTED